MQQQSQTIEISTVGVIRSQLVFRQQVSIERSEYRIIDKNERFRDVNLSGESTEKIKIMTIVIKIMTIANTAIGTKMAPPYAILFMPELEETFLASSPLKPFVWWRYIDNIFMIWQHGEEKLKDFLKELNNCHPYIKFTSNYSQEKIDFLDVRVIRSGNQLITDLFVKPTDTHQYLHASSCHVYHSKRAIPYSQTLRSNRICSDVVFFDKHCNELEEWLAKQGYSDNINGIYMVVKPPCSI